MSKLQREEEKRKERFMEARGGSVGKGYVFDPLIARNPADVKLIKYLKDVIKTQKEQIVDLNKQMDFRMYLKSGEKEEHE